MKLTRSQINALADKIHEEVNQSLKLKNEKIRDLQLKFYKKYTNKNKTLAELYEYDNRTVMRFLQHKYKEEFESLGEICNTYDYSGVRLNKIRNEITVQTIECDNLEELIKSVKSKLSF